MDVVRVLETVIEVRVMSNLSSYATSLDDIIDDRTFTIAAPPKKKYNEDILVEIS